MLVTQCGKMVNTGAKCSMSVCVATSVTKLLGTDVLYCVCATYFVFRGFAVVVVIFAFVVGFLVGMCDSLGLLAHAMCIIIR